VSEFGPSPFLVSRFLSLICRSRRFPRALLGLLPMRWEGGREGGREEGGRGRGVAISERIHSRKREREYKDTPLLLLPSLPPSLPPYHANSRLFRSGRLVAHVHQLRPLLWVVCFPPGEGGRGEGGVSEVEGRAIRRPCPLARPTTVGSLLPT